jgi:thiol-disulfide isomerase/thioredoxin
MEIFYLKITKNPSFIPIINQLMLHLHMKKFLKEALVTLLLAFVIVNLISYLRKPQLSFQKLPPLTIPMVNGSTFKSTNYHDKPLIIHFWATWCPTCKLEISNFNTIAKEYNLITIIVQSGSNEHIKKFMKERGLSFPLINDRNGVLAKKFAISAYPTTLLFDKEGKLAFSEVGYTSTWGIKLRMWWLSLR